MDISTGGSQSVAALASDARSWLFREQPTICPLSDTPRSILPPLALANPEIAAAMSFVGRSLNSKRACSPSAIRVRSCDLSTTSMIASIRIAEVQMGWSCGCWFLLVGGGWDVREVGMWR